MRGRQVLGMHGGAPQRLATPPPPQTWPPSQECQEPQGIGRPKCFPHQLLTGQEGEQLLEVIAIGAQRVRRARSLREVIQEPTDSHNPFAIIVQQVDAPNDAAFPLFDDPHVPTIRTLVLDQVQAARRRRRPSAALKHAPHRLQIVPGCAPRLWVVQITVCWAATRSTWPEQLTRGELRSLRDPSEGADEEIFVA